MPERVSIAIVEDHLPTALLWARVVRRGGWRCAGRFADAESAWNVFHSHPPDLLLLDWELPGQHGGWLAAQLHKLHPQVRILVLTCHDEVPVLREAIALPVSGFVRKPVGPEELTLRIIEVLAGQMPLATQHGRAIIPITQPAARYPLLALSPRERDIVLLEARGDSAKEMADKLHISVATIPTYKKRIIRKLNARHFKEAVAIAAGLPNWYHSSAPHGTNTPGTPSARA